MVVLIREAMGWIKVGPGDEVGGKHVSKSWPGFCRALRAAATRGLRAVPETKKSIDRNHKRCVVSTRQTNQGPG